MSVKSNAKTPATRAKHDAAIAHHAAWQIALAADQLESALGIATPAVRAVLDNLSASPLEGLPPDTVARARLELANDGTVSVETLRAFADAVPPDHGAIRDTRLRNMAEEAIGPPIKTARAKARLSAMFKAELEKELAAQRAREASA